MWNAPPVRPGGCGMLSRSPSGCHPCGVSTEAPRAGAMEAAAHVPRSAIRPMSIDGFFAGLVVSIRFKAVSFLMLWGLAPGYILFLLVQQFLTQSDDGKTEASVRWVVMGSGNVHSRRAAGARAT